jgi:hypothetical protein
MPNQGAVSDADVARNIDAAPAVHGPSATHAPPELPATHAPPEFVIFPRDLHVETRAPHNRVFSTVDGADRRFTMV